MPTLPQERMEPNQDLNDIICIDSPQSDQIQSQSATEENRARSLPIHYPQNIKIVDKSVTIINDGNNDTSNTERRTRYKGSKRTIPTPTSVNATSAKKLKMVLEINAAKTGPNTALSPLQIDVTQLLPKFKEYTGTREKLMFFLEFIRTEVEVCPIDNARSLKLWGQPRQTSFVNRIQRAANNSDDPFVANVHSWGKTISALFQIFAKAVWPLRGQSVKTKYRCLYGLRLKDESESDNEEEDNRRWSMGSTSSSSSTQSYSKTFKPTHDILQNGYCYIVRIILPLMNPGDAKRISVESNLAQKLLSVSGSYIPSCSIGNPMSTMLSLRAPLLPLVCAPPTTNGWFHLRIALPNDIKDDESSIKFAHSLWGLAIRYPRRKTIGKVAISFSSCFGSCAFNNPDTVTDPILTDPIPTVDTPIQADNDNRAQDANSTTEDTSDPSTTKESLINRTITVDGSLWAKRYKGKTYHGKLTHITRKTTGTCRNKDVYTVKFVDCEEVFGLSDLRDFGAISEREFDILNDEYQF